MPHMALMLELKLEVHEIDGFSKKVMHSVLLHFSQQLISLHQMSSKLVLKKLKVLPCPHVALTWALKPEVAKFVYIFACKKRQHINLYFPVLH
jgi:hypothetical protein